MLNFIASFIGCVIGCIIGDKIADKILNKKGENNIMETIEYKKEVSA